MAGGSMNIDSDVDEAASPGSRQEATGAGAASRGGQASPSPERENHGPGNHEAETRELEGHSLGSVDPDSHSPRNRDPKGRETENREQESHEPDSQGLLTEEPALESAVPESPADEGGRKPVRRRPKPGERRLQILQTLAEMLETPKGDRITTAALAGKLKVSEAALYRHFASKAQMFEGLIEFIESTLFGLINQITTQEEDAVDQLRQILTMLLSFAERNPGMTRVIIGDALVNEDDRLQVRINQLIDRLELSIKQCFRTAIAQGRLPHEADPAARANLLLSYVQGRWLRFAKGGFKRSPMEGLDGQVPLLIL
jgi:TetR/AcrR family transcriptional regulator